MSAPAGVAIGSVWVPKPRSKGLPLVIVQIHRADRSVTVRMDDSRRVIPWRELRKGWKPST